MKDQLKGALQFIHHEAAGAVLLLAAAVFALVLANSPLSACLRCFTRNAGQRARWSVRIGQTAAALDQRWSDGHVLLYRRTGDQARVADRRTFDREAGRVAPNRSRWRHCRAGIDLRLVQCREMSKRSRDGPFPPPQTSPLRSACWRCSDHAFPPRSKSFCLHWPSSMTSAPLSSSRCSTPPSSLRRRWRWRPWAWCCCPCSISAE